MWAVIAIASESGAIAIDPFESLCRDGSCLSTDIFGRPAYKDGYHLRAEYVRNNASFIDQTFFPLPEISQIPQTKTQVEAR